MDERKQRKENKQRKKMKELVSGGVERDDRIENVRELREGGGGGINWGVGRGARERRESKKRSFPREEAEVGEYKRPKREGKK